jgi:predicted transcriptional regulator
LTIDELARNIGMNEAQIIKIAANLSKVGLISLSAPD